MIVQDQSGLLYGPFNNITTLNDRLACDDIHLCFSVISPYNIIDQNPEGQLKDYTWDGTSYIYHEPIYVPEVPQQVEMKQARLALLHSGLLSTVESIFASMTGNEGQAAKIEWEYSKDVHRNNSLVLTLGSELQLTEIQLDDLFILAATL